MLVRRLHVPERTSGDDAPLDRSVWPYTVPCVADLVDDGLTFSRPVTFLVGENGSGKSTLVEAIAEAFGLDARGGRAGRKYTNDRPRTPLGERLRLGDELEVVDHWRRYLADPGLYLRHLI